MQFLALCLTLVSVFSSVTALPSVQSRAVLAYRSVRRAQYLVPLFSQTANVS